MRRLARIETTPPCADEALTNAPRACARCRCDHTGPNRTCEKCLEDQRVRNKRLQEFREIAGLCTRCDASATPGYRTCDDCRAESTDRQNVLRSGTRRARNPGRPQAAHCDLWAQQFREGWPPVKIAEAANVYLNRVYAALIQRGLHKPRRRAA